MSTKTVEHLKNEKRACIHCRGEGQTLEDRDDADGFARLVARDCEPCDGYGDIKISAAFASLADAGGVDEREYVRCDKCTFHALESERAAHFVIDEGGTWCRPCDEQYRKQ